MTELEQLQKEINGKRVVYREKGVAIALDAIILWPPKGEKVTVKPYGITPEEIRRVVIASGLVSEEDMISIEEISKPDFCFSAFKVGGQDWDGVVRRFASIPEGGEYYFEAIAPPKYDTWGQPSCPYG
jgi:hypothetical protein